MEVRGVARDLERKGEKGHVAIFSSSASGSRSADRMYDLEV